ncbi:MAG: hypothetical protein IID16_09480 [Candidatus Marinimicrobia bacterium]|nr:hypothetical protein [Candidatus Neomarinimicrobiota bacterium]
MKMIYEPMTFITDMILGLVALYFGLKISDVYWRSFQIFHSNLSYTFYFLALSAILGGIFHGFGPHYSEVLRNLLWKGTVISIGISSLFFLLAALVLTTPLKTYLVVRWIPVFATLFYVVIIWKNPDFSNVIKFYLPAMVLIFTLMIYTYFFLGQSGAGNMIIGLMIMFLGAVAWKSGFSLHTHFNHNDIYHVIITVAIWYLYRGGLMLKDFS